MMHIVYIILPDITCMYITHMQLRMYYKMITYVHVISLYINFVICTLVVAGYSIQNKYSSNINLCTQK